MSGRLSDQSRTVQACKRCRSLKSKCVPGHQHGVCQRCMTAGRDCVWPDERRGNRKPRGPSRISQVEKKIDGLVAHIANKHTSNEEHTSPSHTEIGVNVPLASHVPDLHDVVVSSSVSDGPTGTPDHNTASTGSLIQTITTIHDFESLQDTDDNPIHDNSNSKVDRLTTKLLADTSAQPLLEQYRHMAPYFPFVLVNKDTSAEKMCKRSPMILLVIMTVASWRDRQSQISLEKQYKHEFASRTITEPRKDLALLQSMLIYLAWYHYFIDPKLQSMVMLQMCVGLTTELRLEPDQITRMLPSRNPAKRVRYGKDGQRALLGCYYLCSINSSGLRTPNIFKMSSHMYHCAQLLGREGELESDKTLSAMVNIRYLDDRIFDFHRPTGVDAEVPIGDQLLEQLGVWEASLGEMKEKTESLDGTTLLLSSLHATSLELYDSLFHCLRRSSLRSQTASYVDTTITVLSSCLEAGRSFLDTLISIPTEDFTMLPFTIWLPLPRVLITLAILTAPSEYHLPQWNTKAARDRVRLDLFLESLCFRVQSLSRFNPPIESQPDYWLAMKVVLQSVGKWYKRILNRSHNDLRAEYKISDRLSAGSMPLSLSQVQGSQKSSTMLSHTDSANSFTHTPDSTDSYYGTQFQHSSAFQPSFPLTGCPIMGGMNNEFDMDQFMDTGFWGNMDEGFDMMNFDLHT